MSMDALHMSASLERIRLEEPKNRSRYFMYGKTSTAITSDILSITFQHCPDRVLQDARWSTKRPQVSLFRVGEVYVSGSMIIEGDCVKVQLPHSELSRVGLTSEGAIGAADAGVEYVMDNRELLDHLANFLRTRATFTNNFLDQITGPAVVVPINYVKSGSEDLSEYKLNESQRRAIEMASKQSVTWFWGPPGTGKTQTLGAAASYFIRSGHRVLLAALSNSALDQLLKFTVAQLRDDYRRYAITRLGTNVDQGNARFSRFAFDGANFKGRRAGATWAEHVSKSNLVAANLTSLTLPHGPRLGTFSRVIVDEISMANVPTLAVASYFAENSLLLGGDPMQLPPIYPEDADEPNEWFRESAYAHAKIESRHDKRVGFLDTQYRMQQDIGSLVSNMFYDGELRTGATALPYLEGLGHRIIHVDVKGEVKCVGDGRVQGEEQKRFNAHHAKAAAKCVLKFVKLGVAIEDIGVIAPYNAQVVKIREALSDLSVSQGVDVSKTKVSTIHSFQGQERRVIIVDFTDNDIPPTRLTAKKQLVNVSLSRAKEYLVLVGNREYLTDGKYFPEEHRKMFETMFQHVGQTWKPK